MRKRKTSLDEELLRDYEKGRFESVSPSKSELKKYKQAARATFLKDRRVNIRLSSPDLSDIQARAAEEGVPYQTLISSVLHKFVTGRFVEKPSRITTGSSERAGKRRAV